MLINENLKISDIDIKHYIPFAHKQLLCEKVIDVSTLVDENGIVSCSYFLKKLVTDINIMSFYTDLEFNENTAEDYDFLVQSGLFDDILDHINDGELDFIDEMVNKSIEQKISIGNSLSNIVAIKLEKLINSIPNEKTLKKLMNDIPKQLNKIKPENLNLIKEVLGNKQGDISGK